jgi:hypothetical protein
VIGVSSFAAWPRLLSCNALHGITYSGNSCRESTGKFALVLGRAAAAESAWEWLLLWAVGWEVSVEEVFNNGGHADVAIDGLLLQAPAEVVVHAHTEVCLPFAHTNVN